MHGIQIVPGLLKTRRSSSKVNPNNHIQMTSIVALSVIAINDRVMKKVVGSYGKMIKSVLGSLDILQGDEAGARAGKKIIGSQSR